MPKKWSHCKHWLPRLARSTLNELQQKHHEKASLVCVRVQSPFGLALVPCALNMVDLSGQLRCWITQTSLVQKNILFFYFWHPLIVRPAMKRLFCLKAKNGLINNINRPWDCCQSGCFHFNFISKYVHIFGVRREFVTRKQKKNKSKSHLFFFCSGRGAPAMGRY